MRDSVRETSLCGPQEIWEFAFIFFPKRDTGLQFAALVEWGKMSCRACAQSQACRSPGCISTVIPTGAWTKREMPVDLHPKSQPLLVPGFSRLHGFLEDPVDLSFVRKISGQLELPPGKWLAPTATCLSTQVPRGAVHPWSSAPLHPGVPFEDIPAYETNLPWGNAACAYQSTLLPLAACPCLPSLWSLLPQGNASCHTSRLLNTDSLGKFLCLWSPWSGPWRAPRFWGQKGGLQCFTYPLCNTKQGLGTPRPFFRAQSLAWQSG